MISPSIRDVALFSKETIPEFGGMLIVVNPELPPDSAMLMTKRQAVTIIGGKVVGPIDI